MLREFKEDGIHAGAKTLSRRLSGHSDELGVGSKRLWHSETGGDKSGWKQYCSS